MLNSRSAALYGICLVGALGLVSLAGCGGGDDGMITPPEAPRPEYAAREAAEKSGLDLDGGGEEPDEYSARRR